MKFKVSRSVLGLLFPAACIGWLIPIANPVAAVSSGVIPPEVDRTRSSGPLDGSASPGGPTTMTAASRIEGYAPLAVHFGVVNGGSGVVQPQGGDFDLLHYDWDFGDPASGNWSLDGKSRNHATGFVAGHVFEEPGVYTVRLTVVDDEAQQILRYHQEITVLDMDGAPGWTTYYVAADGSDSNNGTSQETPFATFNHAMDLTGPRTRILLRRGDTWSATTGRIDSNGPGLIGAYGSGDRPTLQFSGGHGIEFAWSTDNRDWRIVGLRLEGNGTGQGIFLEGARLNQLLVWDLEIERWRSGIIISGACDDIDQVAVGRSRILDMPPGYPLYMGGTRSFVQGNHLDKLGTVAEHTFRSYCANGFSATHNYFGPARHHSMKVHGPSWSPGEVNSEDIVIADNVFEGSTWTVALGPQNHLEDERVRNVRYERNVHIRTASSGVGLKVWARNVTIRNNVFIDNVGSEYQAVALEQRGVEPAPQGNLIYHNTFFDEHGSGSLTPVTLRPEVSDTRVFNNLVAPVSVTFTINGSGTGLEHDNNLATAAPDFVDAAGRDLRVGPNSPAVDAGSDVGVLYVSVR